MAEDKYSLGDGYEEQEGVMDMWLPDTEGDEIEGKVVEIIEGTYGPQYKLELPDGETATTPSHKVLQNRMTNVKVGDVVKIIFIGTEPPSVKGQNPMKMYKVGIRKGA